MNYVSLDSIGIAGLGHDFGALHGKQSAVGEVLDSFGVTPPSHLALALIGQVFPVITRLPTSRNRLIKKLNGATAEISEQLLEANRKEKQLGGSAVGTSRSAMSMLCELLLSYRSVALPTTSCSESGELEVRRHTNPGGDSCTGDFCVTLC